MVWVPVASIAGMRSNRSGSRWRAVSQQIGCQLLSWRASWALGGYGREGFEREAARRGASKCQLWGERVQQLGGTQDWTRQPRNPGAYRLAHGKDQPARSLPAASRVVTGPSSKLHWPYWHPWSEAWPTRW